MAKYRVLIRQTITQDKEFEMTVAEYMQWKQTQYGQMPHDYCSDQGKVIYRDISTDKIRVIENNTNTIIFSENGVQAP